MMKELNYFKQNYNLVLTFPFATGQFPVQDCMFSNVVGMDVSTTAMDAQWVWASLEQNFLVATVSLMRKTYIQK